MRCRQGDTAFEDRCEHCEALQFLVGEAAPVVEMGVTLEGAAVTRCHYATGVPKSKRLLARARCTTIHVVAVSPAGPPPSARHLSPFRFGTVGHGFDTAVRDEYEAIGRLITPVKGARKPTRSVLHAPTG
jgi:hypothetical protein